MPTRTQKSARKAASPGDVETRLQALEAAVTALRSAAEHAAKLPVPAGRFWAIDRLASGKARDGGVVYAGHVQLPAGETYAWQVEANTGDLLSADWSAANAPLAALAHPIRLAILKALLMGQRDSQSLQSLPSMGTTGQLYHHLKELESAGWIRQPRRGEYAVLAERVVPLLAIVAACEISKTRRSEE